MNPAQAHLLQQNRALRKENDTLKVEFRQLNNLIDEKDEIIGQYKRTIHTIRQQVTVLQEENENLDEAIAETQRLRAENNRLRNQNVRNQNLLNQNVPQNPQSSVSSDQPYKEMPTYARCRLRQKLNTHTKKYLEVTLLCQY